MSTYTIMVVVSILFALSAYFIFSVYKYNIKMVRGECVFYKYELVSNSCRQIK